MMQQGLGDDQRGPLEEEESEKKNKKKNNNRNREPRDS